MAVSLVNGSANLLAHSPSAWFCLHVLRKLGTSELNDGHFNCCALPACMSTDPCNRPRATAVIGDKKYANELGPNGKVAPIAVAPHINADRRPIARHYSAFKS